MKNIAAFGTMFNQDIKKTSSFALWAGGILIISDDCVLILLTAPDATKRAIQLIYWLYHQFIFSDDKPETIEKWGYLT